MKVKQLIELLSKHPQECDVNFYDLEHEVYKDIVSVEQNVTNTGKITELSINLGYN